MFETWLGLMCVVDFFFFQAEDGIRDYKVTGVQTCALPIYRSARTRRALGGAAGARERRPDRAQPRLASRSEEHTSELQSPCNLVCRLLLEKKKKNNKNNVYVEQRVTVRHHGSLQIRVLLID